MSSTPNLPQIQAAIVTACAVTAGVSSFNNTVAAASISTTQREVTAIPEAMLPAVDVVYQENADQAYELGRTRNSARFLITGYVATTSTTEAGASTQRMTLCGALMDDLKAALLTSSSLQGGVASYCTIGPANNTAGADAERDSRGGRGTLRFILNVVYYEPVGLTPALA